MTSSEKVNLDIITLSGVCFSCGEELPLSFRGSNPFTIEGWIYFPSLRSGSVAIFVKPDEIVLGITADGHAFVCHLSRHHTVISSSILAANTWYHLGITFDGENMILYLNGRSEESSSHRTDGALTDALFNNQPAELECQVRNFRFWNIVRTPAETLRATWAPVVPQPGLIADFFPELPQLPGDWLVPTAEISRVPYAA